MAVDVNMHTCRFYFNAAPQWKMLQFFLLNHFVVADVLKMLAWKSENYKKENFAYTGKTWHDGDDNIKMRKWKMKENSRWGKDFYCHEWDDTQGKNIIIS